MSSGKVVFNLSNFYFPDAPEFIRDMAKEHIVDGAIKPVDKQQCSFCHRVVENIHASHGTGELDWVPVIEERVNEYGDVHTIETMKPTSKRVVACNDCVRRIKPGHLRVHSEG